MANHSYLNFDLSIERYGDHYRAHVLQSCVGEGSVHFVLPFSTAELEDFTLKMSHARHGEARGSDSDEMAAAKTFGAKLFGAVFQGDVYACLRASLEESRAKEQGLRVLLRLPPELNNLPWEYLYNPAWNQFFSLSVETPLVRYIELTPTIHPLAVNFPLRLLVVISSPSDYDALDVEREWRNLQTAVQPLIARGAVIVDRLENTSLLGLQRQLRRSEYHIFHFIGHGIFDKNKQDGLLIFTDEQGNGRALSGQSLGTLLRDHRSLRLALLNACEGARTGKDDSFAGVAHSLVQMGLPAVIAMQFKISDSAATLFAQEFYAALADGYGVDAALSDARKAIFASSEGVEWGTPVLFSRTLDGRIFDDTGGGVYIQGGDFVDRDKNTWTGDHPTVIKKAETVIINQGTVVPVRDSHEVASKDEMAYQKPVRRSGELKLWLFSNRRRVAISGLAFIGLCGIIFILLNNLDTSVRSVATPILPPGMVLIPAGSFQMGSEQQDDEKPIHMVDLPAFLMDVYEVTNARYAECVIAGKCALPINKSSNTRDNYYDDKQCANYPVLHVSWNDAQSYCKWRGRRLPTEAEWEKAARGGLEGKLYPWGDDDPVCTPGATNGAQFNGCATQDTVAVGTFAPNGYGLFDMAGNALEWVNDWYGRDYYRLSSDNNPSGPINGDNKVLRSGVWRIDPFYLRVAYRNADKPTGDFGTVSFRCAASVPK